MLKTVLLFIPCMTCLFWLALNPFVCPHKDKAFKALELLLAVLAVALFAHAGLFCAEVKVSLYYFLLKQFSTLLVIPAALAYIHSLIPDEHGTFLPAWIALPVSLLFADFILITISGPDIFLENIDNLTSFRNDNAGKLTHFCTFWFFYVSLAVQVVFLLTVTIMKLAKGERHIQLYNLLASIIIYSVLEMTSVWAGTPSLIPAITSVALSCTLFIFSYSGIFHREVCYNSREFENADKEQPELSANEHDTGSLISDVHKDMADEDYLRARFEDLIVSEQLFLKQGTRLSDIASMLNTNRTYVSRMVNNTYNMSFSDYMNTLRIDYAEQYLLHHREAKQSDIATACGFPNASAFNNVFKKITGVTPKIWLATNS